MDDEVKQAIADLERVAEQLTDVSMRLLADAIEAGSTKRPDSEKRVSQARNAVDKAIRLLGGGVSTS